MKELIIQGYGVLQEKDAVRLRKEMNLDLLDYSTDPIIVKVDSTVDYLSSGFIHHFFQGTAFRCYNREIPMMYNNPADLTTKSGWFPMSIGPYKLELNGLHRNLEHKYRNAMMAWGLERETQKLQREFTHSPR